MLISYFLDTPPEGFVCGQEAQGTPRVYIRIPYQMHNKNEMESVGHCSLPKVHTRGDQYDS